MLLVVFFSSVLIFGQVVDTTQYSVVEREVSFMSEDGLIRGIIALPETESVNTPVVLLLHGFAGHMNDLIVGGTAESMYGMTARILAEYGIASLRFDFRGSGLSEGDWQDTTFSGQIRDAISALSFLEMFPEVDPSRIGVIGLSQGGLVAACVAARDQRVKSAVLWSAVAIPVHTYSALLGSDAVETSLKVDPGTAIVANLSWGGTTTLRKEFFDELFTINPVAEIAHYPGSLMVVAGLTDAIVFPQPQAGTLFIEYHRGEERIFVQDSGHIFDLFEGEENLREVIFETLEWLLETL
jgi:hypothetical protein